MQKIFTIEKGINWSRSLGEINIALSMYPNAKVAQITPFSESVGGNGGKGEYGAFVVIEYDDLKQNKRVEY